MDILNTMIPVLGIIGLGALLSRTGFLSDALAEGLNRTVYFVALPALLLRACARAGAPQLSDWGPLVAVAIPTLAIASLALLIATRCLC